MALGRIVFFAAVAVFAGGLFKLLSKENKKYVPDENGWFGTGDPKPDDPAVRPFKVDVPADVLKDLKTRLQNARIGHEQLEDEPTFRYGFNKKTLIEFKVVLDYWANKYDWKKAESQLNAFPQFKTQIEGIQIHFLHVKPDAKKYKKTVPLLLVHGWPGKCNVYEFYKLIPLLTDPQQHGINSDVAFEVVAPSIPGYGFSEAAHKRGLSTATTARIFKKLMVDRLKHPKFFAQGGDWGAAITSNVARFYPEHVIGLHLNMLFSGMNSARKLFYNVVGSLFPTLVFSQPEYASYSMKEILIQAIKESGYLHLQATKPDTVGVGLNDSPVGLMVYILEKFSGWTHTNNPHLEDGGLSQRFTKDELLTIVTIYWINQNIVPSQRFYREHFADAQIRDLNDEYVNVPTGFSAFPHDLIQPPPIELARLSYNLTYYKLEREGGHFAALEVPKLLARGLFDFAKKQLR
ncbi:Epoxide hydrolase [Aphelenchoides fujianensis]|nr:Epoxide hydrolase [Aphelenchoides fujianensis]